MIMATQKQHHSDEESVISPEYVLKKLGEAISTLSKAYIGGTMAFLQTRRHEIWGCKISTREYRNIAPFDYKAVERLEQLRSSTTITIETYLPWRQYPYQLSLYFLNSWRGRSISIRVHLVIPFDDPLIKACQSGDLAELQRLLHSGRSINLIDPEGRPLLHVEFAPCKVAYSS
jgi:hypothetical protein